MQRKSRYIPLTQQPFCCMPTCIQMVLLRRKLQLLPQEEIGYDLGLRQGTRVPKYRKVRLKRLINAMEKHPTGGFHLITSVKKR